MLTVYRSNRAEWLANVLSEQLRLSPPKPFESVEIIVNTWPTGRWLGEHIASVIDISAHIQFPFPGSHLKKLAHQILGLDVIDTDPWKANKLVWHVLEVLPELLRKNQAAPLREWLKQHPCLPGELNKEKWQLARTIADVLDDYVLYRPEIMEEWLIDTDKKQYQTVNISSEISWQPELAQLLAARIETDPFGIQVRKAIRLIKDGKSTLNALPPQLHIFGISSLAPAQIEFIQALSALIDIRVFVLTPCPDLWQRCHSRRGALGNQWKTPPKGSWLLQGSRLEANLGRMGAEFQQLLEGSGESQLGEWNEGDLFAAPANIAKDSGRQPTLLEQLQQQFIVQDQETTLQREQKDDSLLFVACAGQWRQVQLIRDQIIQWLANDETLEPRDILIMTPQIKTFAPLIASVFNDVGATKVSIPWIITDRSQQELPGLNQYVLQIIELANNRLTASGLDNLLCNSVIQKQHGLSQDDTTTISSCLQRTGFRWGLDAAERGGDEVHSLSWCLDRWLLGLILPQKPGISLGGAAPFSEGITSSELIAWWGILARLRDQIKEMRKPRVCSEWIKLLKALVDELCSNTVEWDWERQCFIDVLEDWQEIAGNCQLKLKASVVNDVLSEALCVSSGRFGHRSGKLTISALEPMRAIPHRVIILMGLDTDIFPRYENKASFSLLEQRRKIGDPRNGDQDRYVILEALMSSRQHLLISWSNRDEKSGEQKPPANPIQQWLNQLKRELSQESFIGLFQEPSPNPLDRSNFLAKNNRPSISCDQRNLNARQWLDKNISPEPLGLSLPLRWSSKAIQTPNSISHELLKAWLEAPQVIWLEKLQLKPREWKSSIEDLDSLSLNELQRYQLLKENLDELLKHNLESNDNQNMFLNAQLDWELKYSGQGRFPAASAATLERELLLTRSQSLKSKLLSLGPYEKELIHFKSGSAEILWAGSFSVVIELGRLKAKSVMAGWLNHLLVCAHGKSPTKTVVIARKNSKLKKDEFEIALEWDPMSIESAKKSLEHLQSIASQGLSQCWPIPPESGWELANATLQKNYLKANQAFEKKWNGVFDTPGERDKAEMQLCFGPHHEASDFIENEAFQAAYNALYIPLIENLAT